MKKILFAAAMVAAVSSCSKNEVAINTSDANAVSFSTYTGLSTKGTILDQTALQDGFGVLAYDQGTATSFVNLSTAIAPNFMYNTKVSYDTDWTYSPTKYWSSDAYNYYSFFGYAPYNEDITDGSIVLSENYDTGTPTAAISLAAKVENMIDFVAGQVMNITKYGTTTTQADAAAKVNMYFKHQLTRVSFSAQATNSDAGIDKTYVNITSLRLLGSDPEIPINIKTNGKDISKGILYHTKYASDALYRGGIYTFDTVTTDGTETNPEQDHEQDGKWEAGTKEELGYDATSILAAVTPNTDVEAFKDSDYGTEGVLVQCSSSEGTAVVTPLFTQASEGVAAQYLFLVPPVTTDTDGSTYKTGIVEDKTSIKVEIIYDIVTLDTQVDGDVVVSSTQNLAIAEIPAGTLEQGHAYNYTLTITGSSIVDPTEDPDDQTTPEPESAFDAVKITGTVLDWDTQDLVQSLEIGTVTTGDE